MSKTAKIVLGIILIILIIWGISVATKKGGEQTGKETIKIGSISALTGIGAAIGDEEHKGAELAIKEINKNGGVAGRILQLVSEDLSIDKLKNAGSVAHKLIDIDKVVGIVGPQWDEPATAILPIIEAAKIPMIGPDTTDTIETDDLGAYLFSTWYDNRIGVDVLLKFAESKGWKTATIIRPADAGFWKFTSDLMAEKALAHGIKIIDDININNPVATDFRTFITKAKVKKPDFVFFVMSDPTQCIFFKQMKEQSFNVPVLATESSGNNASLEQCAGDMTNLYFSTPVHFSGYENFKTAFVKEYGREPLFPSAVTAYDAVRVIAYALEKSGGKGGEELQKALSETRDFPGTSLPVINFKENGFVVTPPDAFEMQTVKDGKFVKVSTSTP